MEYSGQIIRNKCKKYVVMSTRIERIESDFHFLVGFRDIGAIICTQEF